MSDLERLRELSEAATPGPWRTQKRPGLSDGVWTDHPTTGPDENGDMSYLVAWCHSDFRDDADAALIAAAVNYVRAALTSTEGEPNGR